MYRWNTSIQLALDYHRTQSEQASLEISIQSASLTEMVVLVPDNPPLLFSGWGKTAILIRFRKA